MVTVEKGKVLANIRGTFVKGVKYLHPIELLYLLEAGHMLCWLTKYKLMTIEELF